MSWWGKVIGGTMGFVMGGPVGAVLGASIGHGYDAYREEEATGILGDNERVQTVFFATLFSVMGHLARADGRVSEEEAESARKIMKRMRLSAAQKKAAVNLFNRGKKADFPLADVLAQFKEECRGRHAIFRMFLELLLVTAIADGDLRESERLVLYTVCDRIGFSRVEFEQMIDMMGEKSGGRDAYGRADMPGLDAAYRVLGLSRDASDEDLRRAYRRLIMQYHPDTLVSKGLPEEMMKFATEKTRAIKAAYDAIGRSRDIR